MSLTGIKNRESRRNNRVSILYSQFSRGSRIECQLTFERYCTSPTLYNQWVGSLTSQFLWLCKGCETGPTVSLSKSNCLQMSLQRQHLLLSHLLCFSKTWNSSSKATFTVTFFAAINHNIITITSYKPWNTETCKMDWNPQIKNDDLLNPLK